MRSFKFIDTWRFSPFHNGDLPWEEDYYHIGYSGFNNDILKDDSFIVDVDWWQKQYDRCINGYEVEDAIVPGGDFWVDKILSYTNEKTGKVYT